MFILNSGADVPLYVQIYEQIKKDIADGRLEGGDRLDPSRQLAQSIGVSRNTVDLAYEKLLSEGYIISRARRGYFVEDIRQPYAAERPKEKKKAVFDMREGSVCAENFPLSKWKQCAAKALTNDAVFTSAPTFGTDELKAETADFLYRYRSIRCSAEDVFIFGGMESCMGSVFTALGRDAKLYFAEDENSAAPEIAAMCGMDINTGGLDNAFEGNCVYLRAFCGDKYLSAEKRREATKRAEENNVIIIENDTGFFYAGNMTKLPALRAYSEENVIYTGTFADIIFPAGIAYAVVPKQIADKLNKMKRCFSCADVFTQLTLTYFLRDKNRDRYLYRMAGCEREKLEEMADECKKLFGRAEANYADCTVSIADTSAQEICQRAGKSGVLADMQGDKLVLCSRGIKKEDVRAAVRLLYNAAVEN